MPYRRLRWFAAVLVLLVVLLSAFWGAIWWRWALAPRDLNKQLPPVSVVVTPGMSPRSVGELLEKQGVIRSSRIFAYLGRDVTILPGPYQFKPSESPATILRRLKQGDVQTVRVTFPEGFTLRQIATRLQRNGLLTDTESFLQLATTQGQSFKADAALPANLEGYLFPDTYRFPINADEKRIVQRMVDTFSQRIADEKKSDIAASRRSLNDIVTIASLIEREAVTDDDRFKIAGVIYNRLARNMRLEIDATVQYALPEHKSRVLYRDLRVDSPYNTYKISGLPPGPICSPGIKSIDAALHPEKSDYLYYVAEAGGKSHRFGRTFAEHQRNIADIRGR